MAFTIRSRVARLEGSGSGVPKARSASLLEAWGPARRDVMRSCLTTTTRRNFEFTGFDGTTPSAGWGRVSKGHPNPSMMGTERQIPDALGSARTIVNGEAGTG